MITKDFVLTGWAALAILPLAANSAPGFVLPPPPPGVVIQQEIPFLETNRSEKLDLYLPTNRSSVSSAVVIIHGGGWAGGDKAAARTFNIATNLAAAGYVCASINYSLAQGKRWPLNLQDCKNGIRFMRTNAKRYRVDPDRIGVLGTSAGGHLALMVAYTSGIKGLEPQSPYPGVSSSVRAVVDFFGITDLTVRRKTDPEGNPIGDPITRSALLLPTWQEAPELWRMASPVSHVNKKSPPTLIVHGRADTTVDRDQATTLAETLKKHSVAYELVLLDEVGHSFDFEVWRNKKLPRDLRPVVIGFFDRYLQ